MKDVIIENRRIGEGQPCFIIGEVGLNHNGSVSMAKKLIDVAKEAGVDAVKFQKRHVAGLAIKSVLDAVDNRFPEFGKTYREIREHLEFNKEQYQEVIAHTKSKGLIFLCTTFDIESADFLKALNAPAFKVASHSVTNIPLLKHLAELGKPIFMSTGMCEFDDIDRAVEILHAKNIPLILFHCVSSYPQASEESNLKLIRVLRERYDVPIGYSGHEMGYLPTLTSVALGAVAVERHITLDAKLVGFDHKLSLPPEELKEMVKRIREIESMMGTGEKSVSDREKITLDKYHVSIVSARAIKAGEVIRKDMLAYKNPGTGLPPWRVDEVVNKKAKVDIAEDTLLTLELIEG